MLVFGRERREGFCFLFHSAGEKRTSSSSSSSSSEMYLYWYNTGEINTSKDSPQVECQGRDEKMCPSQFIS